MSIKKIMLLVAGVTVAFAFAIAPVAQAQTVDLQAQIDSLLATIAALQAQIAGGTTAGTSALSSFNTNLTIGSTGSDVSALQSYLETNGFLVMPVGVAKGYFGPLTKAAVAAWQSANGISPAVGYFGPISRANLNAMVATTPTPTTPGTPGTPSALQGGAGSLSDVDYISKLSNEEVGEGSDDVQVAGLEIEADDESDIEITAVALNFSEGTANRDFDRYADEVSIWFDGQEVARLDADDFKDDDSFDKTISLGSGNVIRGGDTKNLVVAVSGVNNLDSNDEGETWTLEFESIRFRDAQGAVITDSTTGDINDGTGRTFSFEDFASSSNIELRVTSGEESINDARSITVDADDDTDDVSLFSFNLEARGDSDINIDDLPVTFTSVGAGVGEIINTAELWIDGDLIGSESVSSTTSTSRVILFDSIDFTIDAGDKVAVVVKVDINDLGGAFTEGDTLSAAFGETETNLSTFDAEDEEGNDLVDADKTGSATSDAHTFYANGIAVSLVSVSSARSGQDSSTNDSGTFIIKYRVEALDGDVYVSDTATATTVTSITPDTTPSDQVIYRVDHAGTATVVGLSAVTTFTKVTGTVTDSGVTNGVKITDGSVGEFTLTVTRTNSTANGVAALFRTALKGITWATSDTATQNVFDFDLDDYETDYLFLD